MAGLGERGEGLDLAMASGQYRVDLNALDGVVTKLNAVIADLGEAHTSSCYSTNLAAGALGVVSVPGAKFTEAAALHIAHDEMKKHLEEIVDHIHGLVDEFGTKTRKTHGAYQDQDAAVKASMAGGE
ncbi:hypothetical protein [Streptomyces sp. NPDC051569]|uniref:hypothetical protein n=1 Tax=Streptomyces sp. NPDC051569 TaxID=3365661 RepID=UPI0037A8F946